MVADSRALAKGFGVFRLDSLAKYFFIAVTDQFNRQGLPPLPVRVIDVMAINRLFLKGMLQVASGRKSETRGKEDIMSIGLPIMSKSVMSLVAPGVLNDHVSHWIFLHQSDGHVAGAVRPEIARLQRALSL